MRRQSQRQISLTTGVMASDSELIPPVYSGPLHLGSVQRLQTWRRSLMKQGGVDRLCLFWHFIKCTNITFVVVCLQKVGSDIDFGQKFSQPEDSLEKVTFFGYLSKELNYELSDVH